jgi:hypothetical protein
LVGEALDYLVGQPAPSLRKPKHSTLRGLNLGVLASLREIISRFSPPLSKTVRDEILANMSEVFLLYYKGHEGKSFEQEPPTIGSTASKQPDAPLNKKETEIS